MSHSALASFDPLAVHPFTNSSGLMPKPSVPSQYPTMPHPSSASSSTPPTTPTQAPVASPKPTRPSPSHTSGPARTPIFVPFRPDRSSPELEDILLRKKVSDVLSNKQTWSIDRAPVPPSVRR